VKRLSALFTIVWLPLFLILSMSWLFAPALHHAHLETLAVISHYEAVDQPLNLLFRLSDIASALILALCVWRFNILRREQFFGILILILAVLAAIDAIFPVGCLGACGSLDAISTGIHDSESVLGAVILAIATITLMRRVPHRINTLFLGTQIVCGLIAASGLAPHAVLVILEFFYEVVILVWTAWAVKQFAPQVALSQQAKNSIRQLAGIGTMLVGILTIMLALPHPHALSFLSNLAASTQPWLIQHGVIVGVLLLYVSRHVRKGQRRAAVLLAIMLLTQVARYALVQPRPILLAISILLLVLLWWGRSAFDRNTGPLPLASRLQDIAIVFAGVLVAIGTMIAVAHLTHKQDRLYHAIDHTYRREEGRLHTDQFIRERYERPARLAFETLGVTLLAISLWGLFRPNNGIFPHSDDDHTRAERLLRKHSNSSEDYFKLWPEDKRYFFNQAKTGFVAYKKAGSVAFALADPIGPKSRRAETIQEFTGFCRSHGWTACFLLVQQASKPLYEPSLRPVTIGSSAIIDVRTFVQETLREKWWRWQANRAEKAGFTYDVALPPHDASLLAEVKLVSDTWLERAGHSEQGFALGYFDTDYLQRCRLHVLRDDQGRLVAFTNELPTYGTVTQKTIDLIRFLPDVDGAMPVLIMHLITRLYQSGSVQTFDLGFVPLAKVDSTIATLARRLTQSRFSAAGLEQFKDKFRPNWQTNYIAYDGERSDIVDLAIVLANLENALKLDVAIRLDTERAEAVDTEA
jgi:phosphatidylglycerol lysyltransferase